MDGTGYVVLSSRPLRGTGSTEVTVGTPDHMQATVTIPNALVGSALAAEVIRRALGTREEAINALRPVEE